MIWFHFFYPAMELIYLKDLSLNFLTFRVYLDFKENFFVIVNFVQKLVPFLPKYLNKGFESWFCNSEEHLITKKVYRINTSLFWVPVWFSQSFKWFLQKCLNLVRLFDFANLFWFLHNLNLHRKERFSLFIQSESDLL